MYVMLMNLVLRNLKISFTHTKFYLIRKYKCWDKNRHAFTEVQCKEFNFKNVDRRHQEMKKKRGAD